MKNKHWILTSFFLILTIGCQEVIPVELDIAPPKLVVDAFINWEKNTQGNNQKIILTTTTDFYANQVPSVSNASVYITNSDNMVFSFYEKDKPGEYICTDFIPEIEESYTLTIIHDGQTYTATEKMKSVAPITDLVQNNEGGILGNSIALKTFFVDPANEENFYLFRHDYLETPKIDYFVGLDTFFNGNTFFSLSRNDKLEKEDKVAITHFGISKQHFNYLRILLNIAGSSGGAPFSSPSATVRGNVVNNTNINNYPLGYFSLSETSTINYTIK